jgi:hypothetical protein
MGHRWNTQPTTTPDGAGDHSVFFEGLTLTLGDGAAGDAERLKLAIVSNIERFDVMADTSDPPRFGVADSPHAPFIYYDAAPAVGIDFGVIQITLSAQRLLIGSNNETIVEPIAVAHLRGTHNAAQLLRDALNKALSAPE